MLINLLIAVIILGAICYIISLIPMAPPFKQIAYLIIGIIALLCLINLLDGMGHGLWGGGSLCK